MEVLKVVNINDDDYVEDNDESLVVKMELDDGNTVIANLNGNNDFYTTELEIVDENHKDFNELNECIDGFLKGFREDIKESYNAMRDELELLGFDNSTPLSYISGELENDNKDLFDSAKGFIDDNFNEINSKIASMRETLTVETKVEFLEKAKDYLKKDDSNLIEKNNKGKRKKEIPLEKQELFRPYKETEPEYRRLELVCEYLNKNTSENINFEIKPFSVKEGAKFRDERFEKQMGKVMINDTVVKDEYGKDKFLNESYTNIVMHNLENDSYSNVFSPLAFKQTFEKDSNFKPIVENMLIDSNTGEFKHGLKAENVSKYLGGDYEPRQVDKNFSLGMDSDSKTRKMITFDLITTSKGNQAQQGIINKYFNNINTAYMTLRGVFKDMDFEHLQGSVYVSNRAITNETLLDNIAELCDRCPWFVELVKQEGLDGQKNGGFKILDVGKEYSVSHEMLMAFTDLEKLAELNIEKVSQNKREDNKKAKAQREKEKEKDE